MREQVLAVLLATAAAAAVAGIAGFSTSAAWIAAGILLGLWSWLFFGEVPDTEPPE